jgi:hypothetical protein
MDAYIIAVITIILTILLFGFQCWAVGDSRWHRFPGRQQWGWLALNLLLPLLGPLLYLVFGRRSRIAPERGTGKWTAYLKGFLALSAVNLFVFAGLGFLQMKEFNARAKDANAKSELINARQMLQEYRKNRGNFPDTLDKAGFHPQDGDVTITYRRGSDNSYSMSASHRLGKREYSATAGSVDIDSRLKRH